MKRAGDVADCLPCTLEVLEFGPQPFINWACWYTSVTILYLGDGSEGQT